jgi:hypothetical protein
VSQPVSPLTDRTSSAGVCRSQEHQQQQHQSDEQQDVGEIANPAQTDGAEE